MSLAFIILILLVPMLLFLMGLVISKLSEGLLNKTSPFECGFEEFSLARLSFSLKFFLIVLIFLIFDVEIALVLPIPFTSGLNLYSWGTATKSLILILLVGLYIEMNQGSLSWVE